MTTTFGVYKLEKKPQTFDSCRPIALPLRPDIIQCRQDGLSYIYEIFGGEYTTYFKLTEDPRVPPEGTLLAHIIVSYGQRRVRRRRAPHPNYPEHDAFTINPDICEMRISQSTPQGNTPTDIASLPVSTQNAFHFYILTLAFNSQIKRISENKPTAFEALTEFDYKYFHHNPVTQQSRECHALWQRIATLADTKSLHDRTKEYISAQPAHRRDEVQKLMLICTAGTLLLAIFPPLYPIFQPLTEDRYLPFLLGFATTYVLWFAWIFFWPPRSLPKVAFQFLYCPGLLLFAFYWIGKFFLT